MKERPPGTKDRRGAWELATGGAVAHLANNGKATISHKAEAVLVDAVVARSVGMNHGDGSPQQRLDPSILPQATVRGKAHVGTHPLPRPTGSCENRVGLPNAYGASINRYSATRVAKTAAAPRIAAGSLASSQRTIS